MKTLTAIIFILNSLYSFSAPIVDTIRYVDNVGIQKQSSKGKTIYFFCPINSFDQENYLEKFNSLYRKKKIQSLNDCTIKLIFFNSSKSEAKGLKVKFNGADTTIIINEFECIFENFDRRKIQIHVERDDINKYYRTKWFNKNSSLISVSISDSVTCFNQLPDRIPVYENYISQLFKPLYSDSEMIKYLSDSISSSKRQIEILQNSLKDITDSLNQLTQLYFLMNEKVMSIEAENSKKRNKVVIDRFRSSLNKSENDEE